MKGLTTIRFDGSWRKKDISGSNSIMSLMSKIGSVPRIMEKLKAFCAQSDKEMTRLRVNPPYTICPLLSECRVFAIIIDKKTQKRVAWSSEKYRSFIIS